MDAVLPERIISPRDQATVVEAKLTDLEHMGLSHMTLK